MNDDGHNSGKDIAHAKHRKARGVFVRTCADRTCGEQFKTSPRYPKAYCKKHQDQEATVYVPRYNGMHSKIENPEPDDD